MASRVRTDGDERLRKRVERVSGVVIGPGAGISAHTPHPLLPAAPPHDISGEQKERENIS